MPRWVLLWQAVAIAVWTTVATVSAWGNARNGRRAKTVLTEAGPVE